MGLHVVLAATDGYWLSWGLMLLNILKVVIALGLVIFVHELGHFLVAKWAGVKCEKFYLGFDIFGWKLLKFQWGETEYGIGALPLGGYVKMLGQEDNPARLREELERAKAQQAAGGQDGNEAPAIDVAEAERALYDPRSYLAQSVPKRMAIISAGVIMNLVFAVVTAVAAYGIGVAWVQPEIGDTFPGEAAWRAGLRVGDRIERIKDRPIERFADLQKAISVGDIEGGVPIVVSRPGVEKPFTVNAVPDRLRMAPTIGISGPLSTQLRDRPLAVFPGSVAAKANPAFQGGDQIVAIDGQPVEEFYQIHGQLALHPSKPMEFTVKRFETNENGEPNQDAVRLLSITVPPENFRHLGLVMAMGPITAIQQDSPAAKAGLKPGDLLEAIDDEPIDNPLRLPAELRQRVEAGKLDATLTVVRDGKELDVPVTLRRAPWYEEPNPIYPGDPLSIPVLGVAYQVGNRIEDIEPGSPAAAARVPSEAVVARAKVLPPDEATLKKHGLEQFAAAGIVQEATVEFEKQETQNWPYFFYALQNTLPGTKVEVELTDGQKFTLEPVAATDWYNPNRGFLFAQKESLRQATSLGDAVVLGARETWESVTMIFQLLGKLGSQVSPKALGGPVSIAVLAYRSASEGLADLLIFLTVIGANLAVLNFLPIPVLDGGHMVFLAYEGIRGKPPGERIHLALSYLGLLFILGLMIFVLGLDIQRLLPGG